MYKINGEDITMTRGDTVKIKIKMVDGAGLIYTPVEGDVIRFAAKKKYNDAECTILKDIPYDTMELVLNPEDTSNLNQPCSLVYDIELTYNNGDVDTFLKGKLNITEEVL